MENEKLQIVMGDKEKAEIIIREVSSVNELAVQPPVKIDLKGVIAAPLEFLLKRISEEDQINQKRCHIVINREKMTIELIFNENDSYLRGLVRGSLEVHPKLIEFGINTGKKWNPVELGQFIKMNRAYFSDKTANMKLVTELKSFEANVNAKIEQKKTDKGEFADSFSGVVSSNLPESFKVNLPLFKGFKKEEFDVEFFSNVSGREISLQLVSPGAQETMDDLKDRIIDELKEKIEGTAPNIAIIEC